MNKYERSVFVECKCKTANEFLLDESESIKITGRPKNIAEGICSNCGREIIVYASLWIGQKNVKK